MTRARALVFPRRFGSIGFVVALLAGNFACRPQTVAPVTVAASIPRDAGAAVAAIPVDAGAAPVPARKVVAQPALPKQAHLAQVYVGFVGSPAPWTPPRARKRSREAARKLADQLAAEARRGADFAALAKKDSDWPLAAVNGGDLGIVSQGAAGMLQVFDDGIFDRPVGTIDEPYESQLGFHVVKRLPMLHLAHVWVAVSDGRRNTAVRSREAALAIAGQVTAAAVEDGGFEKAAFDLSDDLGSAGRGGDLGGIDVAVLSPAARPVVTKLAVGQTSAPVETPTGYEIYKRLP